jgi:hypothetical protein
MDPRKQYEGELVDYPLTNYPDYEPGHPPRSERFEKIGFLDEVEKIWGSRWGGSAGIGPLARSRLISPTEHELDPSVGKGQKLFSVTPCARRYRQTKRSFRGSLFNPNPNRRRHAG